MTIAELLIKHEGLELKPYRCPAGKLTIGVGHNIDDNGISEDAAMFILSEDIARSSKELDALSFSLYLNDARRIALLDMLFNIGFPRFLKFKKMINALENRDYNEAAKQMLDSRWAKQVGSRAVELAGIVQRGSF